MIRTFTIVAALAALPVLALAQQPEKPVTPPDSTVQKTSEGRLDPAMTAPQSLGLTTVQVRQLQDALDSQGCREGMATGLIDSATKGGVVCARAKLHVSSYHFNDVLKALQLPFTAKGDPDIRAWGSAKPMGMPMKHDSTMGHDTTSKP